MRGSDRDRPEPEVASQLTQLTMEDGAANSNVTPAQNGCTKQNSILVLADKKVREHNEELRPYPQLIKAEKGDKKAKELDRINLLKDKMITAMLQFIGLEKKAVEEEHKKFTDD